MSVPFLSAMASAASRAVVDASTVFTSSLPTRIGPTPDNPRGLLWWILMRRDLTEFLADKSALIAVVGATDHLEKYGAIIYRDMKARGYRVVAVNPHTDTVDGDPAYPSLRDLPEQPDIIDFVVPPEVGLTVARTAVESGLKNIWLQPGAESRELISFLESSGLDFDFDSCIMVRARRARRG